MTSAAATGRPRPGGNTARGKEDRHQETLEKAVLGASSDDRGGTFVGPGTPVYEGMIVGMHARLQDLPVNVCKEKKKTNVRSSASDIAVKLTPPIIFSLEQAIGFINNDEMVEVTPGNIRLRKRMLTHGQRLRNIAFPQRL
ncbi:MAG: hypothetical protein IBX68_09450 [Dehalococcoidia bacterium]|nr:hypothetical protein [Dehalococcoidia bacterium]